MRGAVPARPSANQQFQKLSAASSNPDLNINDVLDVIKHSDPAAYNDFQQQISAMATNGVKSVMSTNGSGGISKAKKTAFVRITEQPASKGLRFRYECEGRSAGSIPGASSTNEKKTNPTIEVVGYQGRAVVVVSCVSSESPYRPHPHNLVGKEGCKKGVCTLEIPPETMSISFQSLGIQCVKKKEIEEALTLREQIRVDPFQTGFSHKDNVQNLDLNCVRLCFQVFLEGNEKGAFTFALKPVVSDVIYDKKAKNDLTICRMTEYSASVSGGKEMLLFCDKVIKDDIQVRFFQEGPLGDVVWEGYGDFQPSDVHKQYGIAFRTPRYHNIEVEQPVKVKLHLRRPSDGAISESRNFELLPLDSGRNFWTTKRMKTANYNIFNNILSVDPSAKSDMVAVSQEELKRKIRGQNTLLGATSMQQQQSGAQASMVSPDSTGNMVSSFPPPAQPARNFHNMSMVPHLTQPPQLQLSPELAQQQQLQQQQQQQLVLLQQQQQQQHQQQQLQQQQQQLLMQSLSPNKSPNQTLGIRPLSSASTGSNMSTATAATDATKQSVNEILSIAGDQENISVYSMQLDQALSAQGGEMTFNNLMKMENGNNNLAVSPIKTEPAEPVLVNKRNPVMGSMTSVATVRESKPPQLLPHQQQVVTTPPTASLNLDDTVMDVDQLYDDVMQCVYDDVDVKYDGVDFGSVTAEEQPPALPTRVKKSANSSEADDLLNTPVSPAKPLPGTPSKMPNFITNLTKKDQEAAQKKKEEREEKEREKQRLKEEKEKLRVKEKEDKEKEKLRQKEEAERKKREKEEAKKGPAHKQSLFQRVLKRTKSQQDFSMDAEGNPIADESNANVENGAPTIPPHGSTSMIDSVNGNANASSPSAPTGKEPTEEDLNDLQDFLDSGNLDHLDNMVNEFAKQYMPADSQAGKAGAKPVS